MKYHKKELKMNTKATQGRFEWNQFPKLKSSEELENYIKYRKPNAKEEKYHDLRAYYHKGFYHYTKLEIIEKILLSREILMCVVGNSNDPMESKISENKQNFHFCFSTGINENLPMWYLYAGVDGKGGCLHFTKSMIYELIENGKFILTEIDEKRNIVEGSKRIPLKKEEYECKIQDIVYVDTHDEEKDKKVSLKYNTMTNYDKISKTEFEKFQKKNQEFIKSLIWYYEKETRILVKLTEKGKKYLNPEKKYAIAVKLEEELCKEIKLRLAPEINEIDEIINSGKYPTIKKFMLDTSSVQPSLYHGQVKMKLCDGCKFAKEKSDAGVENQQNKNEKEKE